MELIEKYFPQLSNVQKEQFAAMGPLYTEWNSRINLVSRKDIDNLYEHHILHSLAIARFVNFKPGTALMDVGTGGGFPGIPLAVMFPDCHFLLLDSIGKKLTAASAIAQSLGLKNVEFNHSRVEDEKRSFDFVLSRAVMPMPDLHRLCRKNVAKQQRNAIPNGLIALKGGELAEELRPFRQKAMVTDLSEYFQEEFFQTKRLIYLPV